MIKSSFMLLVLFLWRMLTHSVFLFVGLSLFLHKHNFTEYSDPHHSSLQPVLYCLQFQVSAGYRECHAMSVNSVNILLLCLLNLEAWEFYLYCECFTVQLSVRSEPITPTVLCILGKESMVDIYNDLFCFF